jgi:hypothetical protein
MSRARLIEHKHDLEGQIAGLRADIRRERNRGADASALETRLRHLQGEHYRTRLQIDRTGSDSEHTTS